MGSTVVVLGVTNFGDNKKVICKIVDFFPLFYFVSFVFFKQVQFVGAVVEILLVYVLLYFAVSSSLLYFPAYTLFSVILHKSGL